MPRTAALIACACASWAAFADPVDWIGGTQHTYVVLPPQSITDGSVKAASFSSDGAYLLVGERPIIPDQDRALDIGSADQAASREGSLTLLVWDLQHRQVKSDWTTDDPTVQIDKVRWIHDTPTALIVMHSTVRSGPDNRASKVWGVMALNAANGQFRWINGLESLTVEPKVSVSPTKPLAMVAYSDPPPAPNPGSWDNQTIAALLEAELLLYLEDRQEHGSSWKLWVETVKANNFVDLDASADVTRRVHTEQPVRRIIVWNAIGSEWLVDVGASKDYPSGLARLDNNGSLQAVNDTHFDAPNQAADLGIATTNLVAAHGKTQVEFNQLWLVGSIKSDRAELLLTPNGSSPILAPTLTSVFFIDGGVAKVRRVIMVSADAGRALREAAKVRD